MFLILFTNAIYASTYSLSKYLLTALQPLYLSGLRMTIAGILLLLYVIFINSKNFFVRKQDIGYVVLIAFLNIFLSFGLELWALQYISSIKVTFLYNLGPFLTPFFSYIYFKEKMTVRKWCGLILGFFGAMPALLNGDNPTSFFGMHGMISFPELAVLAGVAAYCYGWVFMRRLIREKKYAPVTISAWIMFLGGLMSLYAANFFESWQALPNNPLFYLCFALLIILGNFIAMTLYTTLFKYYTITFISFTSLLIPMFAAVYGYLFLGEHITWQLIISMFIVTIGLYIFYQEELRQGYIIQRKEH